MKKFDFAIIGSGAAGAAIASRLADKYPKKSIALIEQGKSDNASLLKIPIFTGLLLRGSRFTEQYESEPVPSLNNRKISLPRGKVLGGSTSINGMVYARGLAIDYEYWAQTGLSNWGWDDVKPYFLKTENFSQGKNKNHAINGPWDVTLFEKPLLPICQAFLKAGNTLGFPFCNDLNKPDAYGFGFNQFSISNGRRVSSTTSFLRGQKNIKIYLEHKVDRVLFKGIKACGIKLFNKNKTKDVLADKIIISSGTIGTPMILIRSGIGDLRKLTELDIPCIYHSPLVGKNLQDHVLIRVSAYAKKSSDTLQNLNSLFGGFKAVSSAYLNRKGPASRFPLEAAGYISFDNEKPASVHLNFLPLLTTGNIRIGLRSQATNTNPGFMANGYLMRPRSRGYLEICKKNEKFISQIHPNYLNDPNDLDELVQTTKVLVRMFRSEPFSQYFDKFTEPIESHLDNNEIEDWVRQNADTVHHLCGTCKMGIQKDSVVDEKLKVRGVENLYIADASVFPTIPSANISAPTVMVAERLADWL